jgi:N-glycosylase/DNA lyase
MTAPAWSGWQPLPLRAPLDAAVLAETLDGGQAFRWHCDAQGIWLGVFGGNVVRLTLNPPGGDAAPPPRFAKSATRASQLHWSAPLVLAESTGPALERYLDAARDPRELADALPWRSDPHLAACLAAFPGLRILRQPFGETLLGFLCSATKQIVQIKQMLALLAERHGTPLLSDLSLVTRHTSLPTWPELALISEADLRACQFGFRARFISQTARFLAAHPGWLEATEVLPYAAAKERLCSLPGVGEKIADCVLLFGANRLEAFPVDTWILKAMAARYGLHGWKPAHVAQFGRAHYGPLAGLAQQYLFAFERRQARVRQ